ncbi:MAG: PAS domain-containing protein, partial [Cytophagaceae bacterium]
GYIALIDRVYQTGETFFGTELPFQLSPGADQPPQTHYYNFTYQAYREADEIVGVSIFAYDVTEQVLARQQREAQQQQLHRLLEQAPVAIAIFRGPEYVIELANPAVCTLWGRTPAQARHKPLFELLPEAAGQGFEELLDGVMATGVPYVAHELPSFIDRHGRRDTVYWDFIYEPLPDSTGAISGVTVVATEVTAQVRARQQVEGLNEALASTNGQLQQLNEELRAANGQLTRTNVDLDNFIYTASHDLKAPISNIEGLLAALQTELPAEVAQAEYVGPILTRMLDSVNRFKQTISHLTDVSKLQKEFAPTVEAVRLAAVIDAVCLDLAPLLHETQAQLTVDVTDTPLLFLSAK